MPIIIWGSRGLNSTLDRGRFYCPGCQDENDYHLKQVRDFFTLYFIPLFPVGGARRYVECTECGGTYKEEVLSMEPPNDTDRLMTRIYEDLHQGDSREDAENRLMDMGLERDKAEVIAGQMAGEVWRCDLCGEHYMKAVKRCRRCKG